MEEFDQNQDIARSGYADMLNDDERNKLFNIAIEISVNALVKSNQHNPHGDRHFNCCDIGTGSGLLSMMVARAFKELDYYNFHVTAFEAFPPMAECAQKVIAANGFSDFVTVLPVMSTQFNNQETKFDLLVAELLDTELIGEDCLTIYQHAVETFCSPTCLFVPHQARIYIEPVASKLLFQRSTVEDFEIELDQERKVSIKVPDEMKSCSGFATVDDLQASALRPGIDFIRFTKPKVAFTFTFNEPSTMPQQGVAVINFDVDKEITEPIVIIMWWDIVMYDQFLTRQLDVQGSRFLLLSCAPKWARSESLRIRDEEILVKYKREVWREHWIQGVYYIPSVEEMKSKIMSNLSQITIHAYHDSCSLAFDMNPVGQYENENHTCHCGKHRLLSKSQLAFLSDNDGLKKLLKSTLFHATQFPVQATLKIQRPAVDVIEEQDLGEQVNWIISLPGCDDLFDIGFQKGESWQQVLRWFVADYPIDPVESFEIKCTQVRFDNLNRIRTLRRYCEGFDLRPLDEMIKKSSDLVDEVIENHYLWEYGCVRLDVDHTIYSSRIHQREVFPSNDLPFWTNLRLKVHKASGDWQRGWALVFWTEFKLKHTNEIFSTGPIKESALDEYIEWNRFCQQSVYFMHDHPFARQAIDIDVGFQRLRRHNYSLSVQRAIDYNKPPTRLRPT